MKRFFAFTALFSILLISASSQDAEACPGKKGKVSCRSHSSSSGEMSQEGSCNSASCAEKHKDCEASSKAGMGKISMMGKKTKKSAQERKPASSETEHEAANADLKDEGRGKNKCQGACGSDCPPCGTEESCKACWDSVNGK